MFLNWGMSSEMGSLTHKNSSSPRSNESASKIPKVSGILGSASRSNARFTAFKSPRRAKVKMASNIVNSAWDQRNAGLVGGFKPFQKY